jgi:hypothetical protein
MADPNALEDLNKLYASLEEQLKMLAQNSGGNQLSQLGGMGPQQPPQEQVFTRPVGGPGEAIGPMFGPRGTIFGGGSPVPVPYGPARLNNSLVAIRDLINAARMVKDSPLGQKAFPAMRDKIMSVLGRK